MAPRGKRSWRKRGGKKAMRRGRRGLKRNTNFVGGPNTCKITETYDLGDILMNTPEEYVHDGIVAGTRAAAVAPSFGLYRIAKMMYTITPYFDTYQASDPAQGNNPVRVPYLYWKINRYGDSPANFTAEYLRDQGSKPIRVDDKIIRISYKPNVLLADAAAANGGSGQVKMTPWLSTDTTPQNAAFALSTTSHYGHLSIIEGAAAGQANGPVARVQLKIVYEFKNPRGINAGAGLSKVRKSYDGTTNFDLSGNLTLQV